MRRNRFVMLKQAVPPIVGNGSNTSVDNQPVPSSASSTLLPPLSTLPHWTRVNNLSRACPLKPLLKDRPPLPSSRSPLDGVQRGVTANIRAGTMAEDPSGFDECEMVEVGSTESGYVSSRRVHYLENCVTFLRQQHNEILSALHDEVDRLKRENRALQFQLTLADEYRSLSDSHSAKTSLSASVGEVRSRQAQGSVVVRSVKVQDGSRQLDQSRSGRRPGSRVKTEEQKDRNLEVEVLELRQALKDEKHRNLLLQEQLGQSMSARSSLDAAPTLTMASALSADNNTADGSSSDTSATSPSSRLLHAPRPPTYPRQPVATDRLRRTVLTSGGSHPHHPQVTIIGVGGVGLKQPALLEPLPRVETSAASTTSVELNTVDECRNFIHKLEQDNLKQAAELHQLKLDLHDALYLHKWTPDAFLIAKAYLASDADPSLQPAYRVPLRQPTKKLPDSAYMDSIMLPPMKLALSTKAVDRNKRTQQQMLNRTRLDRDLLSSHDATDGH